MEKEFLNIGELSDFLGVKKSTIYSLVENKALPHYRIGRLIRFKRDDLNVWLESHRKERISPEKKAKDVLRGVRDRRINVDRIVQKSVEEVKGSRYNLAHGKSDRIKGLRKEVSNGTL